MFVNHDFFGDGFHLQQTCTYLRSNLTNCVQFSIRTGTAWELQSKPSHYGRRLCPIYRYINRMVPELDGTDASGILVFISSTSFYKKKIASYDTCSQKFLDVNAKVFFWEDFVISGNNSSSTNDFSQYLQKLSQDLYVLEENERGCEKLW